MIKNNKSHYMQPYVTHRPEKLRSVLSMVTQEVWCKQCRYGCLVSIQGCLGTGVEPAPASFHGLSLLKPMKSNQRPMNRHDEAVSIVADQIRGFYDRKEPFRIYHGSTNSTRQLSYQRNKVIDTSDLVHVLSVDTNTKTALVEPNVPMDRLVEATLQHGLLPPVVMEFPGITVGGGFSGTSGESSSFKHGAFDCAVTWIEIVLGNGKIVHASETENPDLFYGAAGAFGTLGVVTLLGLRLIEAKAYVELTYQPVTSVSESIRFVKDKMGDRSIDYLDGILLARDRGVVMTGRLVDTPRPDARIQRFSRATDPWFYVHVKRLLKNSSGPIVEAIPITEYLFRYDRGAFWTGAYAFQYFMTPFNRITRFVLDKFMHTRVMYHALHESGFADQYVIQDLPIPFATVQKMIEYIDDEFKIWPLWLCPLRAPRRRYKSLHTQALTEDVAAEGVLSIGLWGPGPTNYYKFIEANRKLEQRVAELGGIKVMYARTYYTEDEFWTIYDRRWYDSLRTKYDAVFLPRVYDKVKTDIRPKEALIKQSLFVWLLTLFWSVWPFKGLYGVYCAMMQGDYLLKEKSPSNNA